MKCLLFSYFLLSAMTYGADYVILTWKSVQDSQEWSKVIKSLHTKHQADVYLCEKDPQEWLGYLQKNHPRYVAIVGSHDLVGPALVKSVHVLMRNIDADPYTDCAWGIITGRSADDAMKLVQQSEPLVIKRTVSATRIATECCEEAETFDELVAKGHSVKEKNGAEVEQALDDEDSVEELARAFSNEKTDFIITSGHATTNDWQPGYRYKNGSFHCRDGVIYGKDLQGKEHLVKSDKARVYLPCGNCLMGAVDGPNAMALAWMHGSGVRQMAGYIEPTWYGYMGWGMMDYFLEQPGRYNFSESFLVNHHALIHRLLTNDQLTAMDKKGLEFDRDVVAFYGDPAWDARMADGKQRFTQQLTQTEDRIILEIKPLHGAKSFTPVNMNGSQRGGRPFIAILPKRIDPAAMKAVSPLPAHTILADDFVLVPRPAPDSDATIKVVWEK